jgi:uncharacterized membrane protein (DUF106 family)
MHKILIVMLVGITVTACSSKVVDPYNTDKPLSVEAMKQLQKEQQKAQQKDQASVTKDANKLKCQDARLDLVDAEGEGDINMIRQVKARVQKLCVTDQ